MKNYTIPQEKIYTGTAAGYAHTVLELIRTREDLRPAITARELSPAEQAEVLSIAVDTCKTCKMAKLVRDVVLTAIADDLFDLGKETPTPEELAESYFSSADPVLWPREELEKEFFATRE